MQEIQNYEILKKKVFQMKEFFSEKKIYGNTTFKIN